MVYFGSPDDFDDLEAALEPAGVNKNCCMIITNLDVCHAMRIIQNIPLGLFTFLFPLF